MPLPFITEIIPVHSPRYRIIGMRCGSSRKGNKLARNVYFFFVGLFAIVTITTFIVIYSRIAYRIFRHFKIRRHQIDEKESANVEDVNTENNIADNNKENQEDSTVCNNPVNSKKTRSYENNHTTIMSKQIGSEKRRKKNQRITYKMAIMFITITLVFLVCFIPNIIVLTISGIYKDFVEQLSTSQRSLVMFVYNMHIINNIVNPFIYAFMDTKFRKETRTLLRRAINCH
ncbi:unnamed protein product [Mytilus coruscus]|uniref:G-protein coupled receptors family 1 profile domain-containing protein n=1 Tax=Mytilus coruscus TaxID=42192 RepID=A0A6J7ZVB1_MYTCO|nr:unnamed protein product [Mytilus coruscus]